MSWAHRLLKRCVRWVGRSSPPLLALPHLTDQGLYSVEGIRAQHFSRIYDPEYRLWRCSVLFAPIDVYTQHLEMATIALSDDSGIMPHVYNNPLQSIALWEFFLDAHGQYIDPVVAAQEWQAAATAFIVQYRDCEATIGSRQAHTLQVLDVLLNNTVSLLALFEAV